MRLLCRELRRLGVEVRLVTRRASELARRAAGEGVPVRELAWGAAISPAAIFGLAREIRRFRPVFVHAHDSHALAVALLARGLAPGGGRVIATRRVVRPIRRLSAWRRVPHLIAVSPAVRDTVLRSGRPAGEITVVPSGIDPDEVRRGAARPLDVRRRLGLPPGTPLAVNVAALAEPKDQRTLVRAAAAARRLHPDLHWAIAGEGPLRGSLEAEISRLGVGDRVHLLGYVEEADALIGEADVFVMSSSEEGLGSVILHALALGKPAVATAGGGIADVLPPEALVPVGAAEALGRKVVDVLTHPPSPAPLPQRFTAPAMARGVLAVYRSLL